LLLHYDAGDAVQEWIETVRKVAAKEHFGISVSTAVTIVARTDYPA
jgi:hypothetical protein